MERKKEGAYLVLKIEKMKKIRKVRIWKALPHTFIESISPFSRKTPRMREIGMSLTKVTHA